MAMTPNQRRRRQQKERNRERRRAAREEKRRRPTTLWIKDPIEIILRVLMARGLPEELARMIIFGYHVLMRSSAWALTTDRMFQHMPRMFDTWDGPPDLTQCCCGMTDDHYYYDLYDTSRREEWYVVNVCRQRYGRLRPMYRSPVSKVAACHSRTISRWRGNCAARDMQDIYESYGMSHDVQLWDPIRRCSHTMLWHRLWATMRGIPTPVIPPREFSFVRWLKEAPMWELAEAIETNRGRAGYCISGTRQQRAAVLMTELEWHSAEWWGWNRCRLNQQPGFH